MPVDHRFSTRVTAILKSLLNEDAEIIAFCRYRPRLGAHPLDVYNMNEETFWEIDIYIAPKRIDPVMVKHRGVFISRWSACGLPEQVVEKVSEHTGLSFVESSRGDCYNGLIFR